MLFSYVTINIYGNSIEIRLYALQWPHDERLKSAASRLFTQPFVQGADQRNHQSSALQAVVGGIYGWLVTFPHKWPVTRKMFPFGDVIMDCCYLPAQFHARYSFVRIPPINHSYDCNRDCMRGKCTLWVEQRLRRDRPFIPKSHAFVTLMNLGDSWLEVRFTICNPIKNVI